MVEERKIAAETGKEDPINDNYDKTTEVYHSVVDFVLPLIKARQAGFMIASHNEDTILYVLRRYDVTSDVSWFLKCDMDKPYIDSRHHRLLFLH